MTALNFEAIGGSGMAEKADAEQRRRGEGRRFAKGQSGNAAGRPRGGRYRTTVAVEKLLEGEAGAIARKAVELAMGGDSAALRLVLERVLPVRRGKPVCFALPRIETAGDVSTALGGILAATAEGALTPDEAATVAGILETKRRALETLAIETRLAALEQTLPGNGR
jgi:Family of unknown function (DUF5681)